MPDCNIETETSNLIMLIQLRISIDERIKQTVTLKYHLIWIFHKSSVKQLREGKFSKYVLYVGVAGVNI